jgi:uncharacterized membrane protein YdjX (TVP38/TMEM64 family)
VKKEMQSRSPALRRMLLIGLLLALIIVPFLVAGERFDAALARWLSRAEAHRLLMAWLLGGFLAADVLLPVPSSILSTACGLTFGFFGGTLISTAGMTGSAVVGYWIGRTGGAALARRTIGERDLDAVTHGMTRFGDAFVVVLRAVPVLAEASTVVAGIGRMPFLRFLTMTVLANLGVSSVYAAVGAGAARQGTFLVAFLASLALPGLCMLFFRRQASPGARE